MITKEKQSVSESARQTLNDSKNLKSETINSSSDKGDDNQRPFTRINFYMMGGCVALIIIGFLLMSGGGTDDPAAFNPEIFSTRRIVVGPTLSFLGFLLMAFAIIYTPKNKKKGE